jgi:hypothetical protein
MFMFHIDWYVMVIEDIKVTQYSFYIFVLLA